MLLNAWIHLIEWEKNKLKKRVSVWPYTYTFIHLPAEIAFFSIELYIKCWRADWEKPCLPEAQHELWGHSMWSWFTKRLPLPMWWWILSVLWHSSSSSTSSSLEPLHSFFFADKLKLAWHDTNSTKNCVGVYVGVLLVKQIGPYEDDVLIRVDSFPGETWASQNKQRERKMDWYMFCIYI